MSASPPSPRLVEAKGRDSVRFFVAKGLPYSRRLLVASALFVTACALQLATLNALAGIPALVAAVLLLVVKGYDSRLRLKTFDIDPTWKSVPIERIRELEALRKRANAWDKDAFDASNPLGCITFLGFNMLVGAIAAVVGIMANDPRVGVILALDGLVVVWAFWFTGMRFILKQPNLSIKVRIVLKMHDVFTKEGRNGEAFRPALMFAHKGRGSVPVDTRFSIAFPGSPDGFWGLQAQISLNIVQGTSYPYFYCVLVAKPGFGIDRYLPRLRLPGSLVCEHETSGSAEVLVIRQKTTKNSGYHTNMKACETILKTALEAGRTIAAS